MKESGFCSQCGAVSHKPLCLCRGNCQKKPRVSDSHSGRVFTISLQPVCWQKRVHWNSFYRCQIDLTMPFKIWQKIWQVLHLLVLLLASETLLFCEIVVRNPSFESYLSESTCLSQRLVCTLFLVKRIWEQIRDFPSSTGIKLNQTYEVLQFKQHLGFLESRNSVECANSKTVTRSSRRSALFDLLDPTQPQIWPTDHRIW